MGGIGIEFERRAAEFSQNRKTTFERSDLIDTEMFKYVADQLVQEADIELLLHCYAVDTIMEGRTLKGIITESKSGRQAILAERVIDATGDADIAVLAGVPYSKTPMDEMMRVTVMFSCSGVNVKCFLDYVREHPAKFGDWGENWKIKTTGVEDGLFSTYLEEPFKRAREAGLISAGLTSIGGTWSR